MKRILSFIVPHIFIITVLIFPMAASANKIISSNSLNAREITEHRTTPSLNHAPEFEGFGSKDKERSFHSDLDFFETVMSYGINTDPRITFFHAS